MSGKSLTARAAADLLEQRIGQEFDGECHLTADEARSISSLLRAGDRLAVAGRVVLSGLNGRIEAADHSAVPVFDGIADLHDAFAAIRKATESGQ